MTDATDPPFWYGTAPDVLRKYIVTERAAITQAKKDQLDDYIEVAKWGGAMALPFGDLWLIYKAIEEASNKARGLGGLADAINKFRKDAIGGVLLDLFGGVTGPIYKFIFG